VIHEKGNLLTSPFYILVSNTHYTHLYSLISVDSQLYYPEIKLSKYTDAKDISIFNDWLGMPLYLCTLQTRRYDTKCLPYFFFVVTGRETRTCITDIYS
jgi:hypothetical protein